MTKDEAQRRRWTFYEAVKDGILVVSVEGHSITGGWTLVLLHNCHHGKDFASDGVASQRRIRQLSAPVVLVVDEASEIPDLMSDSLTDLAPGSAGGSGR
jgi:hypothetical protein